MKRTVSMAVGLMAAMASAGMAQPGPPARLAPAPGIRADVEFLAGSIVEHDGDQVLAHELGKLGRHGEEFELVLLEAHQGMEEDLVGFDDPDDAGRHRLHPREGHPRP